MGLQDTVELAAGSTGTTCLGTGTVSEGAIELNQNVHVKDLHGTLISVGQVCDKGNIVLFTKDESIIPNITKFSVNKEDIVKIISINHKTGLCESNDPSPSFKRHVQSNARLMSICGISASRTPIIRS